MNFAPLFEEKYLSKFLEGAVLTLELTAFALLLGLLIAVPLGIWASAKKPAASILPKAFIYFFRGSPLLVQMYMLYHGVAQFEAIRESWAWIFLREAYWCALIAFSLNTAAYTAEIIRGAIQQTGYGELEAAKAYGMSPFTALKRIILPSAFRRALPAYGNEAVFMLHGTSIASTITLLDLLGAGRFVNSRTFLTFESFILVGLGYLIMTFVLVMLFKLAERRWLKHLRPA